MRNKRIINGKRVLRLTSRKLQDFLSFKKSVPGPIIILTHTKMSERKTKIIVILGQTATGKSDFAVQIAKHIQGEIISADSRQVYTGLNLGTGKITKKEMQKIPHHLIDVVKPTRTFTVTKYQKLADKKIKEIIKKGNVPIVCGGTGFYIDALVSGQVLPKVKPNKDLRKKLSNKTKEELFEILKKIDKNRAKNIDKENPIRLIRAIEIAQELGNVPTIINTNKYNTIYIGLTLSDADLKENIHTRLISRIKKGMINEVKNLHGKEKISWKRMYELGLEYRFVAEFLQKKITKDEMIKKLNTAIWHYAKRQKTWFKRNQKILWINPKESSERNEVINKIKLFLN